MELSAVQQIVGALFVYDGSNKWSIVNTRGYEWMRKSLTS
jgi:hypothetical protein